MNVEFVLKDGAVLEYEGVELSGEGGFFVVVFPSGRTIAVNGHQVVTLDATPEEDSFE